jgi:peptide deformylase
VDGPAGPPASPAASATPAEPAAPLTPVTPDTPDTPPAPPASVTPDTPDTQAAPPASVTPDTPAAPVNAPDGFLFELLNPVVVASDGETFEREGCLSVPGVSGLVKRPERVTVKAYDRDGNEVVVEGEGILAKALCHEIDHLEGVLFTDIAEEVETLGQREAEELEGSE